MASQELFYSKADDAEMIQAFEKAKATFKYFWRELSWEFRRIVPALDLAVVKVALTQQMDEGEEPLVEHMWLNDIEFDGDTVTGVLINTPNELTNVENGDFLQIPLQQVSDWLFAAEGKTYGGFTVQLLRSQMSDADRAEHDEAWGLDFGDFNDISVVFKQKEHPENLVEHPMSINMKESLQEFLTNNPEEITHQDEFGYALLHRESIAGNRTSVEVLLDAGADRSMQTQSGKTALDFAKQMQWEHLLPVLEDKIQAN